MQRAHPGGADSERKRVHASTSTADDRAIGENDADDDEKEDTDDDNSVRELWAKLARIRDALVAKRLLGEQLRLDEDELTLLASRDDMLAHLIDSEHAEAFAASLDFLRMLLYDERAAFVRRLLRERATPDRVFFIEDMLRPYMEMLDETHARQKNLAHVPLGSSLEDYVYKNELLGSTNPSDLAVYGAGLPLASAASSASQLPLNAPMVRVLLRALGSKERAARVLRKSYVFLREVMSHRVPVAELILTEFTEGMPPLGIAFPVETLLSTFGAPTWSLILEAAQRNPQYATLTEPQQRALFDGMMRYVEHWCQRQPSRRRSGDSASCALYASDEDLSGGGILATCQVTDEFLALWKDVLRFLQLFDVDFVRVTKSRFRERRVLPDIVRQLLYAPRSDSDNQEARIIAAIRALKRIGFVGHKVARSRLSAPRTRWLLGGTPLTDDEAVGRVAQNPRMLDALEYVDDDYVQIIYKIADQIIASSYDDVAGMNIAFERIFKAFPEAEGTMRDFVKPEPTEMMLRAKMSAPEEAAARRLLTNCSGEPVLVDMPHVVHAVSQRGLRGTRPIHTEADLRGSSDEDEWAEEQGAPDTVFTKRQLREMAFRHLQLYAPAPAPAPADSSQSGQLGQESAFASLSPPARVRAPHQISHLVFAQLEKGGRVQQAPSAKS